VHPKGLNPRPVPLHTLQLCSLICVCFRLKPCFELDKLSKWTPGLKSLAMLNQVVSPKVVRRVLATLPSLESLRLPYWDVEGLVNLDTLLAATNLAHLEVS
jgi:hypothetical protein